MTIYIIIGTIVGCVLGIIIGHLVSARKTGVLQSQLNMQQEHSAELLKNEQIKAVQQAESLKKDIQKLQDKLDESARLLNEAYTVSASLKAENRNMAEKLETQKEEIASMHKQFNLEFENIANKIFQQKTETFNKLSTESLSSLLKPFGDNLNEFKHQVAEVYEKESKQRFSLED
ncbi:MAG: DNA recombination protein RmuC, partial [Candidatus Phocaeicola faecipullorum]|nr:DNA recombination protein RmuC [Candidatus Phocaeicola faecipullorum]